MGALPDRGGVSNKLLLMIKADRMCWVPMSSLWKHAMDPGMPSALPLQSAAFRGQDIWPQLFTEDGAREVRQQLSELRANARVRRPAPPPLTRFAGSGAGIVMGSSCCLKCLATVLCLQPDLALCMEP